MSDKKAGQPAIEALQGRKLVKQGVKDKASGAYDHQIPIAGKTYLGTAAPAAAPSALGPQAGS